MTDNFSHNVVDCISRRLYVITESLELSNNKLYGTLTNHFQTMSNLRNLVIDLNALEGDLQNILDCGDCSSNFQQFSSKDNPIGGTIPPGISQLTAMTQFHIVKSKVSGVIPTDFGLMENLTDLDLTYNIFFSLDATLPSELGNLEKIETIFAGNSAVGGTIPSELSNANSLKELRVDSTYLTGTIPDSVCQIAGLQQITHSSDVICSCEREYICVGI
jgi:hypothetical protein